MNASLVRYRSNKGLAQSMWGKLSSSALRSCKDLTDTHRLSVAGGDLRFLEGRWYVTHAGLLRVAQRNRCSGVRTAIERRLSDSTSSRWVFRATVYKSDA